MRYAAPLIVATSVLVETPVLTLLCVQLPTEYFTQVLGRWKKYSSCLYTAPSQSLDQAEENMLGTTPYRRLLSNQGVASSSHYCYWAGAAGTVSSCTAFLKSCHSVRVVRS